MDALACEIEALERRLLDLGVRASPEQASELLADGFREFGKSGHAWRRDEIIAAMAAERHPINYRFDDFGVQRLGEDAALALYTLSVISPDGSETKALRSSVWQRGEDDQWRMLFHQGTKCE